MARESGLTVGELREMSQAGELTAERFSEMLMNSTALNQSFQNMATTTDQLEQAFADSFTFALAKMDELLGVSEGYRGVLAGITRELDQFTGREGAIANIADAELFRMAESGAMSFEAALAEINARILESPVGLWHIWTNSIPEDVQNLMTMRDTIRQMQVDAEAAAAAASEAGTGLGENVAEPVNQAAEELNLANQKLTAVLDDFADSAAERIARQRNELELAALEGLDRALVQIRQEEERRLDIMIAQVEASEADTAEKQRQIAVLREVTRETIASRQEIERQTNSVTQSMRAQQESLRREQERTNNTATRAQENYTTGWSNAFDSYSRDAEYAVNTTNGIFASGTRNMLSSLDEFVRTGRFSFETFVSDIGQLVRGSLVQGLSGPINNLLGGLSSGIANSIGGLFGGGGSSRGGGGFFSGISNAIGSIFGRRALGGPVMAGSAYMVGETGRELFMPNTSGSIIPAGDFGGMNINFTVNAVDTVGFDDYLNRRRGDIVNLVRQAVQENRGRY
jgi:lambda family phage tail tape measure protein